MATLVYQGIKYVSDSNGYFKDKHNNTLALYHKNLLLQINYYF